MNKIHITSTKPPFDQADTAAQAAQIIAQAEAMGLLDEQTITQLDLATMRSVVEQIARAGIGRRVQAAFAAKDTSTSIGAGLDQLAQALADSPAPAYEWTALTVLFDADTLGDLLGISPASVRRYTSAERQTPDAVAERLHFIATVVGLLAGAYNEVGIRRWFERPRQKLDGQAPKQLLHEAWFAHESGPQQILQLAQSLQGGGAT